MRSDKGRIHSIESFGTVDGPGVRMTIFFQGCPMRCRFCHNPDTWSFSAGEEMDVASILDQYEHNRAFYGTRGGITATGGEPLSQLAFLTSLFAEAHARGINTCLDTSAFPYRAELKADYEELLSYTDLVLLDIKHSDPEGHKTLTGRQQDPVLAFGDLLKEKNIPVIIRHVVVPGITDQREELEGVGRIISSWPNVRGLDTLAYHTLGRKKYEALGLDYPLEGVRELTAEEARAAREVIITSFQNELKNRR